MKISILVTDGGKQIMLTPETPHDREALKYIEPNDDYTAVVKQGTFSDRDVFGVEVYECKGGYYRVQEDRDSVMFILKPAKP